MKTGKWEAKAVLKGFDSDEEDVNAKAWGAKEDDDMKTKTLVVNQLIFISKWVRRIRTVKRRTKNTLWEYCMSMTSAGGWRSRCSRSWLVLPAPAASPCSPAVVQSTVHTVEVAIGHNHNPETQNDTDRPFAYCRRFLLFTAYFCYAVLLQAYTWDKTWKMKLFGPRLIVLGLSFFIFQVLSHASNSSKQVMSLGIFFSYGSQDWRVSLRETLDY